MSSPLYTASNAFLALGVFILSGVGFVSTEWGILALLFIMTMQLFDIALGVNNE